MTEAEFRDELTKQGFETVREVEWEAGKTNASHSHDFTAYGLVLRGQFTLESAAGVKECGPGDTFFMTAGNPHEERIGPDGASLLVGRK